MQNPVKTILNQNKVSAAMTCMDGLTPEQAQQHMACAFANIVASTTQKLPEGVPAWAEYIFTEVGPQKRNFKIRIEDVEP